MMTGSVGERVAVGVSEKGIGNAMNWRETGDFASAVNKVVHFLKKCIALQGSLTGGDSNRVGEKNI